jgi:FlaA1/EpsC-like NDP-sugar epimerase
VDVYLTLPLARLRAMSTGKRQPLVIAVQLAVIPLATYCAFWLRFDGDIPPHLAQVLARTLPSLIFIRALAFVPFGLYGGLWRYVGIWDLTRLVLAVLTSSTVLYATVYRPLGPALYPRSVVLIDALLLVSALGGMRLVRRLLPYVLPPKEGRRVLVIGAGDAGEMIVREMRKGGGYVPVGFIDDDRSKLGHTIDGVKVLGTRADLRSVIAATKPQEALVAIPSASPGTIRSVVAMLEGCKLSITTLPSLKELVNGRVGVKQIRPLAIEDLLPRTQVSLDSEPVKRLIEGKRVLVTGAGGSIGSELCRQIAALGPSDLILFERYENSLFAITNDLRDRVRRVTIRPLVGDVTDPSRVRAVFAQYRPQIVFHAAAHKHVPLMEANPCEAIKNNVVGTQVLVEHSRRAGVERFVLISTDKAANPSSVMGASKRVAELIVQAMSSGADGQRFVTVRFGNVLGSNGSVIPRMLEQIKAGGPVTVTHPEIRRYFMLIPEAVQLVLQAAAVARDRETFVLDMGEQIKILDVARHLIRLAGRVPDEEIPIKFIGLRPGEKLVEELTGQGEVLESADVEKVFRLKPSEDIDAEALQDNIASLVAAARHGRANDVIRRLQTMIPTFTPEVSRRRAAPPRATGVAPMPSDRPVAIATMSPHK